MRSTMKPSTAGIFMILLGGLALYLGIKGFVDVKSLLDQGVMARGQVVEIEYLPRSKPSETPTFTPIVQWTASDGRIMRGKGRESSPREDSFRVGESYDVYYDPADPERRNYILKTGEKPSVGYAEYIPIVIGLIFLVAGSLTLLRQRGR